MCGQCRGLSRMPDWYLHVLGDDVRARRLARSEMAGVATRALAQERLTVANPPGSTDYSVRATTGRTVSASSVDEVLAAVRTMTGHDFDPWVHRSAEPGS